MVSTTPIATGVLPSSASLSVSPNSLLHTVSRSIPPRLRQLLNGKETMAIATVCCAAAFCMCRKKLNFSKLLSRRRDGTGKKSGKRPIAGSVESRSSISSGGLKLPTTFLLDFDSPEPEIVKTVQLLMDSQDAADASLYQKHSYTLNVTTDLFTYPDIHVFYHPHPKADLLPSTLPLVVFIHGLGGQIQQFQPIIDYLVHFSHVLAIDLPGCGESGFDFKDPAAYTTSALSALVATIVNSYRDAQSDQSVVLIGHSMGCALGATLVTKSGLLEKVCAGFVAICPKAAVTEKEKKALATVSRLPEFIFDAFRLLDRYGGTHSKSVNRFVGKNATEEIRELQLRYNEQSKTPVWLRMAAGIQLPTREQWTAIRLPILLLGAVEDQVTPMSEVDTIHSWLHSTNKVSTSTSDKDTEASPSPVAVVKKCVIPAAGHGVMYESPNVVCGLLGEFFSKHVDEVLSLGWQLLHLKEDKWLLKNFEKWNRIQAVSPRIVKTNPDGTTTLTPFRAMKTLRQNDANGHNPIEFCNKWTDVRDVIDISHEQPPYDPSTFGSDLNYHKYPTVSKIPPTLEEVAGFIKLVDSIRAARNYDENSAIACHCHYGFNRTGFFVCSYLIERLGFSVQEAIDAFKEARAPGIRHPHFINELFERYCLGLLRAPTF